MADTEPGLIADLEAPHEHVWKYVRTFENWFDGDEEDLYECACGEKDRRYIPR